MTIESSQSVLILGAGLTGLTAAYHLSRQGHHVTLLDSPGWYGGFGTNRSDPAPFILGCHHETWHLLRELNGSAPPQSNRTLSLEFRLPGRRIAAYRSARLPGALQWMMSLFSFHGLAWQDRWKLFSHLEQIWEQARSLPADLESRIADEWLTSIGQSRNAQDHIWSPLAQWLTGNALDSLSAATFVQQLSRVFLGQAADARLTHLHGSIEDRFLSPMKQALERRGVRIQNRAEQPDLRVGPDGVNGVHLQDGTLLQAQWYISALPHQKLLALLPERLLTRYAYFAQLGELEALPGVTVQLTGHSTMRTPRLLLSAGRLFHRLTVTSHGPHEVRCRLSAIGNPALLESRDDQLIDLGQTELSTLSPEIGIDGIQSIEVSREEQAALSLRPGAALRRPIPQSPIQNLLIAGAWTETGWPANIESAVVSAKRCTDIIARHSA